LDVFIAVSTRDPGVYRPAEQNGVPSGTNHIVRGLIPSQDAFLTSHPAISATQDQTGPRQYTVEKNPGPVRESKQGGGSEQKFLLLKSPAPLKESKSLGKASKMMTTRRLKPKGKKRSAHSSLPPEISSSVTCHSVYRFQVISTATTMAVNTAQLLGICGVIGKVNNTSVTSIASSVKLKRITVWPGTQTSGGTVLNPDINWGYPAGTDIGKDASWIASTPAGVTNTGPLTSTPPKGSLCDKWFRYDGSTPDLFTLINVVAGSIVDVSISFTLRNHLAGVDITVATAAVGTMYYLYLDSSGGKFQPVGRPTTL